MNMTTLDFETDAELKARAEAIYLDLGITLDSAIKEFLLQSVQQGGFPFEMRLDPEERDAILAKVRKERMRSGSE